MLRFCWDTADTGLCSDGEENILLKSKSCGFAMALGLDDRGLPIPSQSDLGSGLSISSRPAGPGLAECSGEWSSELENILRGVSPSEEITPRGEDTGWIGSALLVSSMTGDKTKRQKKKADRGCSRVPGGVRGPGKLPTHTQLGAQARRRM